MHPRIAERRRTVAAGDSHADPFPEAQAQFEEFRDVLRQGQSRIPAAFWAGHLDTMEILCAALDRVDPEDRSALARLQILVDAMRCVQDRVVGDLTKARFALTQDG
ncbi:MAG TPA: hypothetical protein VFO41_12980 [Alphaproteobacteria bacterium]|nr:hypothetical protein [Alphaproteobacteria bacterium]